MALATNNLAYGLRDVGLYAMDAAGALSNKVDLPAAQTFSFSEAEDFEELRGDDKVIAIRGKGPKVEWDLAAGGISLTAYVILAGGTTNLSGTTPNQVFKITKKTTDVRPYFRAEGQAISDSGGDFHARVFKCRVTDNIEGELADGAFWVTSCSGEAIGDSNDNLYELYSNESVTVIPTVPPAAP
jgi:hypothetical protein